MKRCVDTGRVSKSTLFLAIDWFSLYFNYAASSLFHGLNVLIHWRDTYRRKIPAYCKYSVTCSTCEQWYR